MSASIDVELTLRNIDEACRDWPQKFKTTNNELIEAIQEFFYDITRALIQLSNSTDDNEQSKQNQLNAERIVSKSKELRHSLGDIWPSNMDSFGRDIFDVASYHIEAAEFFHPVPFYPGDDILMKLYRWSVYDTNRIVIHRYYLERSEVIPGQQYYVLGKSYPNGHSQIRPYGSTAPDYNQMKSHVINDLTGQGPQPIILLSVPSRSFAPLNDSNPSRYQKNSTVESIFNQLMVEQWNNNFNYEKYYNQCSPSLCSYSYIERNPALQVLILVLGLYGGLTIIMNVVALIIVALWHKIWIKYRRRHVQVQPM